MLQLPWLLAFWLFLTALSTLHVSFAAVPAAMAVTTTTAAAAAAEAGNALKISVLSWNLGERAVSERTSRQLLRNLSATCDVLVLGVQECEDVRPRRREGHRSRAWRRAQRKVLLPRGFVLVTEHRMGGMQLAVHARSSMMRYIEGFQIVSVACGVGNVLTNKGAICALLRVNGSTLALVNSHLAAHQGKVALRNDNYRRIMSSLIERAQSAWLTPPFQLYCRKYMSPSYRRSGVKSLRSTTKMLVDNVRSRSLSSSSSSSLSLTCLQVLSSVGLDGNSEVTTRLSLPTSFAASSSSGRSSRKTKRPTMRDVRPVRSNSGFGGQSQSRKLKLKSTNALQLLKQHSPFDTMIFFGDLNYRIDLPRTLLKKYIETVFPPTYRRPASINGSYPRLNFETSPTFASNRSSTSLPSFFARILSRAKRRSTVTATAGASSSSASSSSSSLPPLAQLTEVTEYLLKFDQLKKQIRTGRAFVGFQEAPIRFVPSFKYDLGSARLDSSKKGRAPAWTDRVLFRSLNDSSLINNTPRLQPTDYDCLDCRHSDHRPVLASFHLQLRQN